MDGEISERILLDLCLPHVPELLGSQEASQKKIIRLALFQLPLIPEKELITVFSLLLKGGWVLLSEL